MSAVLVVSAAGVCTHEHPHRLAYYEVTLEALRDAANEIEYLRPEKFDDWSHRVRFNQRQDARRALIHRLESM